MPKTDEVHRRRMAEDAEFFLTTGKGYKGPQSTVLSPGKYRINTKLFTVTKTPATNIDKATVGVVKSNVGDATLHGAGRNRGVDHGFLARHAGGVARIPLGFTHELVLSA